jgi:GGDEF domain-containing protein
MSQTDLRISDILIFYHQWFGSVLRLARPEGSKRQDDATDDNLVLEKDRGFKNLPSFDQVVQSVTGDFGPSHQKFKDLKSAYQNLMLIVSHIQAYGDQVELEKFDQAWDAFQQFQKILLAIEFIAVNSSIVMDQGTGLHLQQQMILDITREMERMSRGGLPFTLVLTRLDVNEELAEFPDQIKNYAQSVKKMMRSFDDAYRLGHNEILINLKHCNAKGGPIPGDDLDILLANVRRDLYEIVKIGAGIGEYEDLSPIQRFVRSKQLKS